MTETLLSQHVILSNINELPALRIQNEAASATIVIQGAHVTEYTPVNQQNLLFVSQAETFLKGEAIRGGIPICWPWFGPHSQIKEAPAHGLVRQCDWQYEIVTDTPERTDIRFWIETDGQDIGFNFKAKAELLVSIGHSLIVSLTTTNNDDKPLPLSQALHSYFNCKNIDDVRLHGISGECYLDKVTHKNGYVPLDFKFDQEIDWIVMDKGQPVAFTGTGQEPIKLTRMGSRSLVIWNPWIEKSKSLSHFSENEYTNMFCVETSNTSEDSRLIKPNCSHAVLMEIATAQENETN